MRCLVEKSGLIGLLAGLALLLSAAAIPQSHAADIDPKFFNTMKYRSIGPFRGGRVTAVEGVPQKPFTFFMGATGGGVWKTEDAGESWSNISDGYFNTAGIGAIDVSNSDPNIIYVGTGEGPVRGVKTSHGDGVYKSTDGGKSWRHLGLEETRHIPRIIIHPTNPDIVVLAAQGNPWGPNKERGIYRSVDGGKTWTQTLFVNENSGIADISISADNPNHMMATSWDFRRKPWVVKSGGDGSKVWRSTDGGISWSEVTKGLPNLKGKMGVSISPADPNIVYLAIEAKDKPGVYRSDDGGLSFRHVSDEPNTYVRAWYYMHITADPVDPDEVWVMNGVLIKSIDGGKNWTPVRAPHVDHHALWINPDDTNVMINGNDGGANVTLNGGKTWSSQGNQPTGQFYRVITDNTYPYRIYAAQQDSNGITITSQSIGGGYGPGGIGDKHWWSIGSGESATIAFDPEDPKYVYTTYFASFLGEWNRDTHQYRNVRPYPERVTGEQPKNLKYRANWNGPVIVSPHDPARLYYGSQYVMTSTDRGVSWEILSPDLTRNNKDQQGKGGYPISNEQITAESYNNLFVIAESPVQKGVIWTGSDDGLVHVSQDGGQTWANVTPQGMDEGIINVIDASPFDPGTMVFARAGFKMNDFTPSLYITRNFGKSWKKITKGLPDNSFARTIRFDPKREGLLYTGLENGMFVSFDNGANWQSLQLNLPQVPITDLHVRQDDLVVATQGRSLWILDDLTPLHQLDDAATKAPVTLLKPRDVIRNIYAGYPDGGPGANPPQGLQVHYLLADDLANDTIIKMEIVDDRGRIVHSDQSDKTGTTCGGGKGGLPVQNTLTKKAGDHRWSWNLMTGRFDCLPEIYRVSGSMDAYRAIPGDYAVRLTVGDSVQERPFTLRMDPRLTGDRTRNLADYAKIGELSQALLQAATDMSADLTSLRLLQDQMAVIRKLGPSKLVLSAMAAYDSDIESWISVLVQKELKTFQNVYQYEGRLLMKLKDLLDRMGASDVPLTQGFSDVTNDYLTIWADHKEKLIPLKEDGLAALNSVLEQAGQNPLKWID